MSACCGVVLLSALVAMAPAAVRGENASIFDITPGLAQAKAFTQFVTGDYDGMRRTTKNFWENGIGLSQVRSAAMVLAADPSGAYEEQKKFVRGADEAVSNTPVVGFVYDFAKFLLKTVIYDTTVQVINRWLR